MNIGASNHDRNTHSSGGGGREDCWSDGATSTLIEAWGDRYVRLNRGNLRQKDWGEVADAVNSGRDGVKPKKTDVQCKNRMDTLKRKYKQERAKPPPSKWAFFNRIEVLIGGDASANKKLTCSTFTIKPKSKSLSLGVKSTESSSDADDEVRKKQRVGDVGLSDGVACRELARAILKFGEIYERIESSKQQQMMDLEKQRIEFTKDLEFQRMNMLVDAHLEMEKLKRQKQHFTPSGKKCKSENRS
ncbi:Trihelix transcription factor ASIL2 [Hibiscus syriacus]|uniref:Trihelix transcription factor ASIL2 n=1 Tax=Hibiscus syriacus TaxID=106335 RepID=A0A6A2Z3V2_HIBSY|nr:trihelix transcription factor ASIL2-like [Hibiscus syriacus]KAE8686651.1 Trihelix transcription factor ASIL2 [Hibiscus syriacus]